MTDQETQNLFMNTAVQTDFPSGQLLRSQDRLAPCVFVVFGASGDLATRKLFPALYHLFSADHLPDHFGIIGCSRTTFDDSAFQDRIRRILPTPTDELPDRRDDFVRKIRYQTLVYDNLQDYDSLSHRLESINASFGTQGNRLFYLAVPPQLYPVISTMLGRSGLAREKDRHHEWSRIVLEKPFGHDLPSALELSDVLHEHFSEHQIFRIDHYLAKETVQNLLMFRFANTIFEPLWNRNYIEYVSISAAETLGVEKRAGYYEQAGVIRDMFQNHMMQLLSLVAMEAPSRFQDESVRDDKTKVFNSLRPFELQGRFRDLVLGQYGPGNIDHHAVPGYRQEEGVAPDSLTPTFAFLRSYIDNWRWQGVPFYICSGKRLSRKLTRIVIQFKDVPHSMFRHILGEKISSNRLILGIQPDEVINLTLQTKSPGMSSFLRTVTMRFDYNHEAEKSRLKDAYEKVLMDCLLGDQMLFWRQDAVKRCWAYLTPILEMCESCGDRAQHLHLYPAGTWGPKEVEATYENYLQDHI
ncbi:glucose-6-phosphate 1-dehydrogenase [Desulfonatronum thiosulfatophilum]|uniref:Glucose-6-phosphate 1-dehydrogenase n=1 Tax=Desulfonatronum thiosulfatophilum TaxID=617002 RepID=A0A1G6B7P6_9BACT|nr:glucose-6-phosphate dehydrogenase [Desulfonatronum thiosulfatophilum]SDB16642.1 glucose-6-phosphate 1-dehydrogenase [Desulfonatronum thiosulfatophilum]